jgi:NTE family protein
MLTESTETPEMSLLTGFRRWNYAWLKKRRHGQVIPISPGVPDAPRIAVALGGGFARGIAHVGVLRVIEREKIPLHCITGVSAGAIVAAAFASGATTEEIAAAGSKMRFNSIARWGLSKLGLASSERMTYFLRRLLKHMQFDDMQIPLGVVATDLRAGTPVYFRGHGDVAPAIRASCSYPGLFRPVEIDGRTLVDGAMTVEVPAEFARTMGANRVISVCIPNQDETFQPHNMFEVINRCFQIMMARNDARWRSYSDLILTPDVANIPWDGFANAKRMVEAGEAAAEAALPKIREWLAVPAVTRASAADSVHDAIATIPPRGA